MQLKILKNYIIRNFPYAVIERDENNLWVHFDKGIEKWCRGCSLLITINTINYNQDRVGISCFKNIDDQPNYPEWTIRCDFMLPDNFHLKLKEFFDEAVFKIWKEEEKKREEATEAGKKWLLNENEMQTWYDMNGV
jgi:hypothetical protein